MFYREKQRLVKWYQRLVEGQTPTRVYFLVAVEAGALREAHLTELALERPLLHHQSAHVLI